jgi:hypothetical protein
MMKIRGHPAHSNRHYRGLWADMKELGVERTLRDALILRSLCDAVQSLSCRLSLAVVSRFTPQDLPEFRIVRERTDNVR